MQFPLSWLKDYIDLSESPIMIGEALTSIGIELEAFQPVGVSFTGVVVATVTDCSAHPDADTLSYATVFDGQASYKVVCGAPNCRTGIKVALARIGATIKDFTIEKRKLRGVLSEGMLCSHEELDLPDGIENGIMELSSDLSDGTPLALLYCTDVVFEVGLTPNLAHCNSVRGIARELSTYFNRPLKQPVISFNEEGKKMAPIQVTLHEPCACPHYACRTIAGVKVAPSSPWLQERIEQCGLCSVNNVVDAANLVMLEIGQPLHTFDLATLNGNKLDIRFARTGESLTTLDGVKRNLTPKSLLICDGKQPVALGGVMGSAETSVSEATTDILLESAYFEPTTIRKSAKQNHISSQASYRFERGVDPEAVLEALDRAAALIAAECDGEVSPGVISAIATLPQPKKIQLRLAQIKRVLGINLAMNEVIDLLKRMSLKVLTTNGDNITINAPTYRHDINGEIDLIEEVARFYGYDHLQPKERSSYRTGTLTDAPLFTFEQKVRKQLLKANLQELLTCDLISKQEANLVNFTDRTLIHVLNPSSLDQSILRPSLLPGILTVLKHNHDHDSSNLSGFEIGRIHFQLKDDFYEQTVAAIALSGKRDPHNWQHPKGKDVDFYDLKGIVEQLLDHLSLPSVTFKPGNHPTFHPGQQAIVVIEGREVGVLGQVHPKRSKLPIFYAELNLEDLLPLVQQAKKMKPLPLYPSSSRDWTLTIQESVSAQTLLDTLNRKESPLLESVSILDLYRGERLGSDWKSITLRFVYRDQTKTLSHQSVDKAHNGVMEMMSNRLKGKIK